MRRIGALAAVLAVVLAACGWPSARFDVGRTGYNAIESRLGRANVGSVMLRSVAASDLARIPDFVVARDRLFVAGSTVRVFDLGDAARCTGAPRVCSPEWQTGSETGSPEVIAGTLYVGGSAYDADGAVGCAGTPTACNPGWLDTFKDVLQTGPTDPSHLRFRLVRKVIRGFEHSFVLGHQVPQRSNCPVATDGIAHCKQLWTGSLNFDAPGAGTASEPAVADGRVFASYNLNHRHTVVAFDGTSASGLQLWNADFPNALGTTVAVARGTVVVPVLTEAGWVVAALDAAGVNNCTATQCRPMWVTDPSAAPTAPAPAVAGGVVYVAAGSELRAYDLAGAGNCGGTPRTCLPLWTAAVGVGATAPTVANGVVYTSSTDGSISAFDARGISGCTPSRVCSPLWQTTVGQPLGPVEVADGRLYVGGADGLVRVFGLD